MAQKGRSGRMAGGRKTQGSRSNAQRGGARGRGSAGKGGTKTAQRKQAGRTTRSGRTSAARGRSKSGSRSRTGKRAAARAAEGGGGGRGGRAGPKWINAPEEHADRPGQTLATRNHDVIRQWAEERGGQPATTGNRHDGRPGVLRFDFPGYGGGGLEHISWDDWFRSFDERNLVFLYQERLKSGRPSNFFRLDNPAREAA